MRACVSWLLAAVAVSVLLAGCHNPAGRPAPPQSERLPVEPDERPIPLGPALLDTVTPWTAKPLPEQRDWQLAVAPLPDTDLRIFYRVPFAWAVDGRGRARSRDGLVRASAVLTPISDDQLSLAAYVAQLSEGQPIYSRATKNGYTTYLVGREVSVAPSDPNVARRYHHTAVVDIDGRIAKLDVIYDVGVSWRFREVGNAIIATMEVDRRPE